MYHLRPTNLGTEARFLLLNNAFSLGFRRLECRTSGENIRAQNAIARAGFEFEGRAKKKYVVKVSPSRISRNRLTLGSRNRLLVLRDLQRGLDTNTEARLPAMALGREPR